MSEEDTLELTVMSIEYVHVDVPEKKVFEGTEFEGRAIPLRDSANPHYHIEFEPDSSLPEYLRGIDIRASNEAIAEIARHCQYGAAVRLQLARTPMPTATLYDNNKEFGKPLDDALEGLDIPPDDQETFDSLRRMDEYLKQQPMEESPSEAAEPEAESIMFILQHSMTHDYRGKLTVENHGAYFISFAFSSIGYANFPNWEEDNTVTIDYDFSDRSPFKQNPVVDLESWETYQMEASVREQLNNLDIQTRPNL